MKRKNQLSSFDITVLTMELREIFFGGFVDKIYQPNKKEMQIRITVPTAGHECSDDQSGEKEVPKYKQINLVIKIGQYLYALPKNEDFHTNEISDKPSLRSPGSFAMLLRKHLKNGKIMDIYQHEFDRIIVLEIQKKDKFQLVIELFGDGNLILVKEGKIIQPLFSKSWSYRTVRAGFEFNYPPAKTNPIKIHEDEFCTLLSGSKKDLVRTLIMDLQIPGIYAEELCLRCKLDKNAKANQISQKECEKLFRTLNLMIQEVKTQPKAYLMYKDDEFEEVLDFVPIQLKMYDELNPKEEKSYNSTVRQFFEPKLTQPSLKNKLEEKDSKEYIEVQEVPEKVNQERARLLRQEEQQNKAIARFSSELELNHNFGEAIYTNYLRCENLLNEINDLRKQFGPEEIFDQLSETKDIKELNPHEGYVILIVDLDAASEDMEIKLNIRKNVIENANHYYELSKHSKEKLHGAQKALKHTQELLNKLKIQAKSVPKRIPKERITKHYWFEKYHWFITTTGNIVVGGRDAKSNDQVVKRHLKDKDRYCHADMAGAASVVVKHNQDDDTIPEASLEEACQFAVIYSKAWNAKIGAGNAYWVKPDQVSKTPQSGEFLARGAFVIRGKRNFVGNIKLQLAVGELEYKGHYKLMAGPVESISALTSKYVILRPGNIKKNDTANELSSLFNVAVDDILSLLPSGEFAVVDKVGFKD